MTLAELKRYGNDSKTHRSWSKSVIALKLCLLTLCALLGFSNFGSASERSSFRFGESLKRTSFSFWAGASMVSGNRNGIGANTLSPNSNTDSLYSDPRHIGFEYGEHSKHTTLALGLEFTSISASDDLKTMLKIDGASTLSVSYIDAPITYRINAFPSGRSALNVSAGLSLIPMLDIAKSSLPVFSSGAGASSGEDESDESADDLSDKHVDFGFGFGGEVALEQRLAESVFVSARAGFRHPFSGVTRPDLGFFLVGIRIYQK